MRTDSVSVAECKRVLKAAIGEMNAIIPDDVLEWTIFYLNEYVRLKIEKSWDDCPERMGR